MVDFKAQRIIIINRYIHVCVNDTILSLHCDNNANCDSGRSNIRNISNSNYHNKSDDNCNNNQ